MNCPFEQEELCLRGVCLHLRREAFQQRLIHGVLARLLPQATPNFTRVRPLICPAKSPTAGNRRRVNITNTGRTHGRSGEPPRATAR
jgi:hypothetical protein